jgi:nucleoside-diphosphate-sugar epimerase
MRVFVTGASGHIGSAVVPELLGAGHEVVGLARSDASAAALSTAGAEVHRGALDDLDGLSSAAAAAEGVIHLAYDHSFSDFVAAATTDLRAIEAIGAALEGSDKPFVVTSGTLMLAELTHGGHVGLETDAVDSGSPPRPRVASENAAMALADRGVRSSVVRLAPSVHSSIDRHGFVPRLIEIARERGVAGYIGDGANRWPAVHTLDAARLFRLALERAPAGSRLHGVGDEGVPVRDIAAVIGRQLGVPAASIAPDDAADYFGFLAAFIGTDNPTSNAITRELVGWEPTHPGLIDDLEEGHYFAEEPAAA